MVATEAQVGMRPAHEYLFLLIAFPVLPFFSGEVKPVTVWLSDEYVRAAVGGTGEAKCAGNYAGSLLAQRQAAEKGCDQVVWLDAVERRWVEEMGGMNLFFVSTAATPAHDAGADRHPAARRRARLAAAAGARASGLTVEEGRMLGRRLAQGGRGRLAVGGLRLRHRAVIAPGRPRQVQPGGVDQRRRPSRGVGDAAAAVGAARPAVRPAPPTRTAG
jgi:hypothetical protein